MRCGSVEVCLSWKWSDSGAGMGEGVRIRRDRTMQRRSHSDTGPKGRLLLVMTGTWRRNARRARRGRRTRRWYTSSESSCRIGARIGRRFGREMGGGLGSHNTPQSPRRLGSVQTRTRRCRLCPTRPEEGRSCSVPGRDRGTTRSHYGRLV
jgi:hypothetical protein